jgi:integrase
MPVTKLTDRTLKALKPLVTGRVDYFDSVLPAFGIRLSATGAASWFVFYRVDGSQVRDIIGRYPAKGLAEAREEARGKLRLVERGRDPRQEDARQRAAEAKRRAETFGTVADEYHEGHLAKLASGEELWQRVTDDLLPAWQNTPIRDIGRGDVMALLDRIEKAKGIYARNRRLALIRHLLNFALDRERVDANVAARIKLLEEPDRDRILTDAELAEVWHASGKLADAFQRFTRMLIATGQRRREVGEMAWPEVDEAEKLWTIPAARMKARELHEVPLSGLSMTLLKPAERDGETSAERGTYIFSTGRGGDRPISGFNKLKLQLDRHILTARQVANPKAKPLPDWRLHDIRRTVRSGLARLQIPPHVAERVLAHVPGGIERVYDLHQYREEKRRALEAWVQHIERITNPQNNVVELRR